jgi:sugar-specific transcriptional regulator TrmB
MNPVSRKWKIFMIQHTHTDVGYTERQEKVEINQIDYIKQAINIFEEIKSGRKNEWKGFKWTCETFWPVEKFLETATYKQRKQFEEAVVNGYIDLSASYLNTTDIIDGEVLKNMILRATNYAQSIGVNIDSAMTADINGHSWGYAQCMADAGIRNFFTCVHTHHGMFPIGRKQYPFWWKTPKGQKILVWNGEHYHVGNDLGIIPNELGSYIIRDEFNEWYISENHQEIAEKRITRYLHQLEKEEYPFDFVPIMGSGILIDNSPPNANIMSFINSWNDKFGDTICIEMTTLKEFFNYLRNHLRKTKPDVPEYSGDWPNWWSDVVASTPKATKFFLDAQRKLKVLRLIDPSCRLMSAEAINKAEYNMMMYTEHTWGHHMSGSQPWNFDIQAQELRKELYAYNAQDLIYREYDKILASKGEATLFPGRPMKYKVINPYPYRVKDMVKLILERWDLSLLGNEFEVVDLKDDRVITHQPYMQNNNSVICIEVDFDSNEEREYLIRKSNKERTKTIKNHQDVAADGILDVRSIWNSPLEENIRIDENSIETPFVHIKWEAGVGIVSWIDKKTGMELIRWDRKHNAFTPVYEVTPFNERNTVTQIRRRMGRNRKAINANRYVGILKGVEVDTKGPLFARVKLRYELEGTNQYILMLTAYSNKPKVDVSVIINKNDVWEPENLYISLPFTTGEKERPQLWIEKTGNIFRPRIDQLPGTGIDF